MMTPSSLSQCWANHTSHIGDGGKRCHKRVDPKDTLGLCPGCKNRLRDDTVTNDPVVRPRSDRPNTPQGRQWAREAGLM